MKPAAPVTRQLDIFSPPMNLNTLSLFLHSLHDYFRRIRDASLNVAEQTLSLFSLALRID